MISMGFSCAYCHPVSTSLPVGVRGEQHAAKFPIVLGLSGMPPCLRSRSQTSLSRYPPGPGRRPRRSHTVACTTVEKGETAFDTNLGEKGFLPLLVTVENTREHPTPVSSDATFEQDVVYQNAD